MKRRGARIREGGEGIVLVLIILAILGGGCWYLFTIRRNVEKEAWDYARQVADHIVLQHDARFVDLNLSPRAQVDMPPSSRERIFTKLRELGAPDKRMALSGNVRFSSYFFEPKGYFRAQINFPGTLAKLDMAVSPSHGPWQIDSLNLIWNSTFDAR